MKIFLQLLISFYLLFITSSLAENRYAVASGNWDSTSTWSVTRGGLGGASVPTSGDNVIIPNPYTVTAADPTYNYCLNLTIENGGYLVADHVNPTIDQRIVRVFGTSVVNNGVIGYTASSPSTNTAICFDLYTTGATVTFSGNGISKICRIRTGDNISNTTCVIDQDITLTYFGDTGPNGNAWYGSRGTGSNNKLKINSGRALTCVDGACISITNSKDIDGPTTTIQVDGSLIMQGPNCYMSLRPALGATVSLIVNGYVEVGRTLMPTGNSGVTSTIIVNSGGELKIGTSGVGAAYFDSPNQIVIGLGKFTFSGGTMKTGSPYGLDPIDGPIRTSLRNFSNTASYQYVGTTDQVTGPDLPLTLNNLTISGAGVTLTNYVNITGTLSLTNGKLTLGSKNITASAISGGSNSSYVVTNGTGGIIRNVIATDVSFPVGYTDSYTPVVLNNSGAADNFTISVKNTFDHTPNTNQVVRKQWTITEGTPGGSNVTVKLQWNISDENPLFDRNSFIFVNRYNGTVWEEKFANYTDLGGGLYSASAAGFSGFSPFVVSNIPVTSSYPTIFIPGIMGSGLFNQQNERIWMRWAGDLTHLILKDDGVNPQNTADIMKTAPERGNSILTMEEELDGFHFPFAVYKNFFTTMKTNGYKYDNYDFNHNEGENLYLFSYDWRKDNALTADSLRRFIDSVLIWTGSNKVNIVAHSMGGIVIKNLLAKNNTIKDSINKIIFVGTPHLGAPKAYSVSLTGAALGLVDIPFLYSESDLRKICRNSPSSYQLYPSKEYYNTSIKSDIISDDEGLKFYKNPIWDYEDNKLDYQGAKEFLTDYKDYFNFNLNSKLIDSSDVEQEKIKNIDYGNIIVYNIVGYDKATVGLVKWRKHNSNYYVRDIDNMISGDGTVPLRSAEIIGSSTKIMADKTYYLYKVEHQDIPANKNVVNIIYGLLQEPAITNFTNTDPPQKYTLTGWLASVYCPVELHAYDQSGNHTGPTSDTTWEENISGSDYIPTNLSDTSTVKCILLPNNGSYTYKIKSQGYESLFSLNILDIQDGISQNSLDYNNIHILPNTVAEVTINDFNANDSIKIDYNGDGVFDSTIAPIYTVLPVELSSFKANIKNNLINLIWTTATEINNVRFDVERSDNKFYWTKIGFVQGNGNSNSVKNYSYIDHSISKAGKYYYRLKQIDNNGSYKFSNIVEVNLDAPSIFALDQNFPNPFNPNTTIKYQIPMPGLVNIKVFDILGREVATLVNENEIAGFYEINFDASKLASGIYIYQLKANDFVTSKKMTLLK